MEKESFESENDPYRPVATGNIPSRILGGREGGERERERESSSTDVILFLCFMDDTVNVIENAVMIEFCSSAGGFACGKCEFVRTQMVVLSVTFVGNKQNRVM
jgi:hypothetical protein